MGLLFACYRGLVGAVIALHLRFGLARVALLLRTLCLSNSNQLGTATVTKSPHFMLKDLLTERESAATKGLLGGCTVSFLVKILWL